MSSSEKIYLKTIKLINFRCHKNKNWNFSDKINIITGLNATGKTSLVEAIHVLCSSRSFKTAKDRILVSENCGFFRLEGAFTKENEFFDVSLVYDFKNKRVNFQNNPILIKNYIGKIIPISFSVDDLLLVKGSPEERRNYLNFLLCQNDEEYLKLLIEYQKILKQRNNFLKNAENSLSNRSFLKVLTKSLVNLIAPINAKRKTFIEKINAKIKPYIDKFSTKTESIFLQFVEKVPESEIKSNIDTLLERDLMYKTTTFGPHRDDYLFILNQKQAKLVASQGQIRSIIISFKLALAELISSENKNIIIILDDVLSELDLKRQEKIFNLLNGRFQTFITTTSIKEINPKVLKESNEIILKKEEKNDGNR